jgi:hypothetical protein
MFQLPVSEYPEIVPPSVIVRAQFPGASPEVMAETVATPLEEQINGVENMLYMQSLAATDGTMTLTVTFKLGSDPDLATQLVQNRVNQALPRLPEVTRLLGVVTEKSSPDLTLVVHLLSPNGRYDQTYLRNYALLNIKDQLAKITGIGSVQLFGGGDYAMRIWLNPQKVAERNMTAGEVVDAIRRQNVQVAGGTVGGPPYDEGVELQLPIMAQGRLSEAEQFDEIIIKRDGGVVTRLKDVARVEVDAATYGLRSLIDNKEAGAIGIFQAPGSNAIEISDAVRARMDELKQFFPEGLDYLIGGVGTGGHMTGVASQLKKKFPNIQVFAFEPELSPIISGGKPGPHPIQGIGANFIPKNLHTDLLDGVLTISKDEAFEYTRRMAKEEGIFVGISSGASLAAVAKKLPEIPAGSRILTFNYDTGERYLSVEGLF